MKVRTDKTKQPFTQPFYFRNSEEAKSFILCFPSKSIMGVYLSQPKTDKVCTDECNDLIAVGASSMQGWRLSQEDAHSSILNFDKHTSFFAIYDGHGGAEVAQYCADKLPEYLKNVSTYKSGNMVQALKDAFLGLDGTLLDPQVVSTLKVLSHNHNVAEGYDENEECPENEEEPGKRSGCTAIVCLLKGRQLFVANAGDSRCVICRNGKAIVMSLDHKPGHYAEALRIIGAGGSISDDGRVNGGLNLSRALGDHSYKTNVELCAEEQMITALPDVQKLIITPEDEFMVLACDGIWNSMSSDDVVDFVQRRLKVDLNKKLSQICNDLFDHCLAPNTDADGTGCDNMTAIIVKFNEKKHEQQATIDPSQTEDTLVAAADQKKQKKTKGSSMKRKSSLHTKTAGGRTTLKNHSVKRVKQEQNIEDSEEESEIN